MAGDEGTRGGDQAYARDGAGRCSCMLARRPHGLWLDTIRLMVFSAFQGL